MPEAPRHHWLAGQVFEANPFNHATIIVIEDPRRLYPAMFLLRLKEGRDLPTQRVTEDYDTVRGEEIPQQGSQGPPLQRQIN